MAEQLGRHVGMVHYSTGELFRQEIRRHSALGHAVSRYVSAGRLVPDRLVVDVMTHQLTPQLLSKGFVLDGFPRTVGQAKGLDQFLLPRRRPLDAALYLACPQAVLIQRLSGRRVCSRCGAIYHLRTMPPKRTGICDRCHGKLVVRKDDEVATVKNRLAIDRGQAKPLLAYYRQRGLLYRLNGTGTSTQVLQRVIRLFRRQGWVQTSDQ